MRSYSLTNADVINAFNRKLETESFTTSANIEKVLTDNADFLTNKRRRIRRYPILPFKLINHAPRYRFHEVEAWIVDVLIQLIQRGKVQERRGGA